MGKYGKVAEVAINEMRSNPVITPEDAWKKAASSVFPESESSQNKGCPRGAFLGLCESGLIKGIPSGEHTRSESNKLYALKAVSILKENPELVSDEKALWSVVMDGEDKTYNYQMDVVISLWRFGLIDADRL